MKKFLINHKYKILIFLLLIIFVLIFGLYSADKKSEQIETSKIRIPQTINLKGKNIIFDLEVNELEGKRRIPAIRIRQPIPSFTETEYDTLAQKIGFDNSLKEYLKGYQGNDVVYWYGDEYTLLVRPLERYFDYIREENAVEYLKKVDLQLSDDEYKTIALRFLNKAGIDNIKVDFVNYFTTLGSGHDRQLTDRGNAATTKVSFSFLTESGLPIVLQDPFEGIISVDMLTEGSIQRAQGTLISDYIDYTGGEYQLKSLDEVQSSIFTEGIIVSLDYGNTYTNDPVISNSIKSITINKLEVGYLFEDIATIALKPIAILTGIVDFGGGEENVVIYVPLAK